MDVPNLETPQHYALVTGDYGQLVNQFLLKFATFYLWLKPDFLREINAPTRTISEMSNKLGTYDIKSLSPSPKRLPVSNSI